MIPERKFKSFVTIAVTIIMELICSSPSHTQESAPHASEVTTGPTSAWAELLQRMPYPHRITLPPATPTVIDGTYTKFELKETPAIPCRRCPDYAPEGGAWKLNLNKGVFKIFHQVTGWRSLGSFTVSTDEPSGSKAGKLLLANDPTCHELLGVYSWKLEEDKLILKVIEDKCAIGLRAMNLSNLPWLSCQPPPTQASKGDQWQKPSGCD